MARQKDALGQFAKLRQELTVERDKIQARLNELDAALGNQQPAGTGIARPGTKTSRSTVEASGLGMREAIQQVISSGPLRIRQIVEAMQQIGFRFRSSNPLNSVGAYLYGKEGKKHFRKSKAGFSPLKSAPTAKAEPVDKTNGRRKRKMSAAGRRAIAEGAKKRWAAYNAAKKR